MIDISHPLFFSFFNVSHPQRFFLVLFLFLFLGNRASTSYCKKRKKSQKRINWEEQGKCKAELKQKVRALVLTHEIKILVPFCTSLTPFTRTTLLLTAKPREPIKQFWVCFTWQYKNRWMQAADARPWQRIQFSVLCCLISQDNSFISSGSLEYLQHSVSLALYHWHEGLL